jgi:ribonuclease HII
MGSTLFSHPPQKPGEIERSMRHQYDRLLGVDEAGRGALCGPVVAAAVALPWDVDIVGLDDSKRLSADQRTRLAEEIRSVALVWGIGSATAVEVEEVNVLQATFRAMRRAIDEATGVAFEPDLVLVDGPHGIPDLAWPQKPLVKGDSRSNNIAAASILAKTSRDEFMRALHKKFPHYGFDRHMGYGTNVHRLAIAEHGLCPSHRPSFCHLKK